ncbi:MAG: peroxidase [Planctomycetes bacterium]|nr:peroxidase [Planctomycetota bacterium]
MGIRDNFRTSELSTSDKLLCNWAEKLTLKPADCSAEDVNSLRAAGFNDAEISHAGQVVSYFNYINRIAEGLGVDNEPEWKL